jgi:hypothetical protein
MIDLKYSVSHYLLPDGTVKFAGDSGGHTHGNTTPPYTLDDFPEGTRRVHFGADHVFAERRYSAEFDAVLRAEIEAVTGVPFEMNGEYDATVIDGEVVRCGGLPHYHRWGSHIYHTLAEERDLT